MSGSFRIFKFAGITVFLHWSWLIFGVFEVQYRADKYQTQFWNVAEYLSLFAIVLLHEFGHALACRSVGGKANQIILWPLGGIAFVQPPPRPGAVLWSIAAGPLVNVVLVPITIGAYILAISEGLDQSSPDAFHFLEAVTTINGVILGFNLLPIYPLDGGQIFQSLLWFVIGRAKSLRVASIVGFFGAGGMVLAAVFFNNPWLIVMAIFAAMRSWSGFQQAQALTRLDAAPRHSEAICPSCGAHPIAGSFWTCSRCRTRFDTFATGGRCPGCDGRFEMTTCPECLKASPFVDWYRQPPG
jgi:Zn-dependent protease